ncbi:MAG: hypothetical protein Q4C63_09900 [Eubacteriales bacterium]|nr:hypothetical protein [Eubacteriales bacterium]
MRKYMSLTMAAVVSASLLAGCSGGTSAAQAEETTAVETTAAETSTEEETTAAEEAASADDAQAEDDAPYTETTVDLGVGVMQVYDFGDIKIHAYESRDAIDDESYLIESESGLTALEAPGFKDNNSELADYIESLGKPVTSVLLAFHPAGAEVYGADAEYIATANAQAAQQEGGSVKGLIDGFVQSFGEGYDGTIPEVTKLIEPGTIELNGVEYVVTDDADGFDLVIPEINTVFTHMVGSDVHNIMPSIGAIDALIAQMQSYVDADYTLILSSHYVPETIEAAKTKLAYAEKMKELAETETTADDFIAAAKEAFPNYSGENYLQMTAAGLYQ